MGKLISVATGERRRRPKARGEGGGGDDPMVRGALL